MKLNTYILAQSLSFPVENHSRSNIFYRPLEYCMIWTPDIALHMECIYILYASELSGLKLPEGQISLICIGKPEPDGRHDEADILYVPSYLSREMILAHISELFRRYSDYEIYLKQFCLNGKSYRDLEQRLFDVFQMPILVLGEFHEVLMLSQEGSRFYRSQLFRSADTDFLPEQLEQALCSLRPDKEGFCQGITAEQIPFLSYSIERPNLNTQIILLDLCQRLSLRERILLHHLGPYILKYREFFYVNRYQNLQKFHSEITRYLNNYDDQAECPESILKIRKKIGWSEKDQLICIIIHSNIFQASSDYIVPTIQLLADHTFILDSGRNIYLCNLTQAGIGQKGLTNTLTAALEKTLYIAGVSSEFTVFSNFPAYVLQAKAALEMGYRLDYIKRVYHYQDYVCDYLIRHGAYSLPLSSVLPEGIKDILEYDRSHHTEYYPTLVSYSRHDMKLKDTAGDLKIHTSTLKYRLQKIKTMLKMDIYEPDNKLYLGIIFFLLESPS